MATDSNTVLQTLREIADDANAAHTECQRLLSILTGLAEAAEAAQLELRYADSRESPSEDDWSCIDIPPAAVEPVLAAVEAYCTTRVAAIRERWGHAERGSGEAAGESQAGDAAG